MDHFLHLLNHRFPGKLTGSSAAMHKLRPFEIVPDKVIKSGFRYFYPCAICELDRHSRLLRDFIKCICSVDDLEAEQVSDSAVAG
jgi:hypothetical protein